MAEGVCQPVQYLYPLPFPHQFGLQVWWQDDLNVLHLSIDAHRSGQSLSLAVVTGLTALIINLYLASARTIKKLAAVAPSHCPLPPCMTGQAAEGLQRPAQTVIHFL